MYKHKNSNMERVKRWFDFIKKDIVDNRIDYKNFLLVMIIFNFILISIVELIIIHPPDFLKKSKYDHKKIEKRVEKRNR